MKITEFINKKLLKATKVQVLEVFIDDAGAQHYSLSIYENNKDMIVLKEEYSKIASADELLKKLKDKNTPIALCVDGKGVLVKKLQYSDDSIEIVAQRIIPNAKTEDFYIQRITAGDEHCFVSLIRKNSIEDLCSLLAKSGYYITELHLGPAVCTCISGLLVSENVISQIAWRNYSLSISKEGLLDVSRKNNEEQTHLPIKPEQLLKFSAACAYFADWRQNSSVYCDVITKSGKEFADKNRFKAISTALILFFLVLLLVNFFVFQHYWKKQQELEAQAGWKENAAKDFESIKKSIAEKMTFALETGLLSEDKLAWLADQLGKTVPEGIRLARLNIYPKEKKVTEDIETYVFNQRAIQIDGYSTSESLINDWIRSIKEKDFAGKVKLASFMHDHDKETGVFKLVIELKD